jgi:exonuclease III
MILAMWNVLSLHRPGALAKLKDELSKYGVAIAAVQEIRWCGCEIFESRDFTVCYSGSNDRRQFGTWFLIHKKYKHLILDFSPETDRICSLWIKATFSTQQLYVHMHQPKRKMRCRKMPFYKNLERMYMKVPKHDIKIVMGDFIAKVGKEPYTKCRKI